MWWFTHPRCVLFPENLHISKSMHRLLRKQHFTTSFNTRFEEVINQCQTIRRQGQDDTWITEDLKAAFIQLHHQGYAHSVEVWKDRELVGGLYGLAIGKVFFGESMFAHMPNASKYGFIELVKVLHTLGFQLVDCQQKTNHLITLGAELINTESFLQTLRNNIFADPCYLADELKKHDRVQKI